LVDNKGRGRAGGERAVLDWIYCGSLASFSTARGHWINPDELQELLMKRNKPAPAAAELADVSAADAMPQVLDALRNHPPGAPGLVEKLDAIRAAAIEVAAK
jgi:hypothetical protein